MKLKKIQKPKHLIRSLKIYAEENCKPVSYYALEKFYTPRIIEGEYKTGVIVTHPVNHSRRVMKAFKKFGAQGAVGYLTVFKKDDLKTEKESI